jgi:hypothetical protein
MMKINFTEFRQTLIDEDDKLGLIPSISNLNELNNWEHENIIDGRNTRLVCDYIIKKYSDPKNNIKKINWRANEIDSTTQN